MTEQFLAMYVVPRQLCSRLTLESLFNIESFLGTRLEVGNVTL